jgi:hypothetical protein
MSEVGYADYFRHATGACQSTKIIYVACMMIDAGPDRAGFTCAVWGASSPGTWASPLGREPMLTRTDT